MLINNKFKLMYIMIQDVLRDLAIICLAWRGRIYAAMSQYTDMNYIRIVGKCAKKREIFSPSVGGRSTDQSVGDPQYVHPAFTPTNSHVV